MISAFGRSATGAVALENAREDISEVTIRTTEKMIRFK
jgi:hypothetical protein